MACSCSRRALSCVAIFCAARAGASRRQFCGLQLVARGICLSRYGSVRSFSVSDGGLCLLDGLLGGGE